MEQVNDIPPETLARFKEMFRERSYDEMAVDLGDCRFYALDLYDYKPSGPPKTGRPNRRVIRLLRDPRTGEDVPPNYEPTFHYTKGYRLVRTSMGQG